MKRIVFFLVGVLLCFSNLVFAQSAEDIYLKANLSYENKDYEKAISLYEMLVKMDRVSPEVFYNLGNSFFKLKKIGHAILNYERALRLAPRDRDIQSNLKLARAMVIDKIDVPTKGFILTVMLFLYDMMNINELAIVSSIFYLVIILLLIFSIFFVAKKRVIFYNIGVLAIAWITLLIFLFAKVQNENFTKQAVIISDKVDARSGPKEDYLLQFTLHEGTKVRILQERQDWYEIDLSKGLRGWLPKPSAEII